MNYDQYKIRNEAQRDQAIAMLREHLPLLRKMSEADVPPEATEQALAKVLAMMMVYDIAVRDHEADNPPEELEEKIAAVREVAGAKFRSMVGGLWAGLERDWRVFAGLRDCLGALDPLDARLVRILLDIVEFELQARRGGGAGDASTNAPGPGA